MILKDPERNKVDRTLTMKDNSDDGRTWQKNFDGSTKWVFANKMQGRSNSPYPRSSLVSALELKNSLWTAVQDPSSRSSQT